MGELCFVGGGGSEEKRTRSEFFSTFDTEERTAFSSFPTQRARILFSLNQTRLVLPFSLYAPGLASCADSESFRS